MGRRNDDRLGLTPEAAAARRVEFEQGEDATATDSTLSDARKYFEWMWLYCEARGCGYPAAVLLAPLIIRWGPDAPWERTRHCFRCTKCGGRETSTRTPSWGGEHVGFVPVNEFSRWTGEAVWPEPLSMHWLEGQSHGFGGKIDYHPVLGNLRFDIVRNLYSNARRRAEIANLFRVSDNRAYAFEPMPAIFPKSVAPIVRVAENVAVLAAIVRSETMPGAAIELQRAGFELAGRRALVCSQERGGSATVRVPWHLEALQGPAQEGRRYGGSGHLRVHDHETERVHGDDHARPAAGPAPGARALENLADRQTGGSLLTGADVSCGGDAYRAVGQEKAGFAGATVMILRRP